MSFIRKLRNSPSGPFVGDPGLRVGPGSTGLIVRAHGDPSGDRLPLSEPNSATAVIPVTGLQNVPVNMQPGYLYDAILDYVVIGLPGTQTASLYMAYALRAQSSQQWGDWLPFVEPNALVHVFQPIPGVEGGCFAQIGLHDELQSLSVTTAVDQVRFGLMGEGGFDWQFPPGYCYARIEEYIL